MCRLSMKFSDTFGPNPSFYRIRKKAIPINSIAKIKSQCPREQKACLQKNLSRGSLSNWCDVDADADTNDDADADADISKTMSTPTLRAVDIIISETELRGIPNNMMHGVVYSPRNDVILDSSGGPGNCKTSCIKNK